MKTEIVVPFTFDTTAIEEKMRAHGEDEVIRIIKEIVEDGIDGVLPKRQIGYGFSAKVEVDWEGLVNDNIREWLNGHSQEIVELAALMVAARVGRTTAWKKVLAEVKGEEQ